MYGISHPSGCSANTLLSALSLTSLEGNWSDRLAFLTHTQLGRGVLCSVGVAVSLGTLQTFLENERMVCWLAPRLYQSLLSHSPPGRNSDMERPFTSCFSPMGVFACAAAQQEKQAQGFIRVHGPILFFPLPVPSSHCNL